ncbi:helix-turn-helix transcriptional regulator [Paenibacillus cymbidii]|uniref:helix-turn-helix transcriptional regulator n=1 Tax=Paenibacillus cymbidii TaxID=1639034 RepID=UPI0010821E84|nr:AraC family transcriptional regulator [Paenibacillus cymbidii]
MEDKLRLPDRALQIQLLEVGSGTGLHNWLHEKTVPYTIIAQAVTGSYEVNSPGGSTRVTGDEAFLAAADTPLAIRHLAEPGAPRMTFRYLHVQFYLYEAIDVFSLFALPPKTDAAVGAWLAEWIGELVRLAAEPPGIPVLTERKAIAYRILSTLLAISSPAPGSKLLLHGDNELLTPIAAFIRERMAGPLAIADMLERFPISRTALFKLFHRYFALTPMEYWKTVRLHEAYRRICATSDTFSSIAERYGFANLQHFSREYKRQFQQTPGETRKKNRLWLSGGEES